MDSAWIAQTIAMPVLIKKYAVLPFLKFVSIEPIVKFVQAIMSWLMDSVFLNNNAWILNSMPLIIIHLVCSVWIAVLCQAVQNVISIFINKDYSAQLV